MKLLIFLSIFIAGCQGALPGTVYEEHLEYAHNGDGSIKKTLVGTPVVTGKVITKTPRDVVMIRDLSEAQKVISANIRQIDCSQHKTAAGAQECERTRMMGLVLNNDPLNKLDSIAKAATAIRQSSDRMIEGVVGKATTFGIGVEIGRTARKGLDSAGTKVEGGVHTYSNGGAGTTSQAALQGKSQPVLDAEGNPIPGQSTGQQTPSNGGSGSGGAPSTVVNIGNGNNGSAGVRGNAVNAGRQANEGQGSIALDQAITQPDTAGGPAETDTGTNDAKIGFGQ